jgi:hypothetical protein
MKRLTLALVLCGLVISGTATADQTCKAKAARQKLAGEALISFVKNCQRSHGLEPESPLWVILRHERVANGRQLLTYLQTSSDRSSERNSLSGRPHNARQKPTTRHRGESTGQGH